MCVKETYKRGESVSQENYIQGDSQKRPMFVKRDQCMSKETRKSVCLKRPTKRPTKVTYKETYKSDLQKRIMYI